MRPIFNIVLGCLFLLVFRVAIAAEPAGVVVDWTPNAWVTQGSKKPITDFQQPVAVGDLITTDARGAVKILFRDDTILTIKENSQVLITEFLFDADAKQRNAVFKVVHGTVRTVVGRFFGKTEPVTIQTPTAVAGIRGTDLGAKVDKIRTRFYCFDCPPETVSVYNPDFPDAMIHLLSNQGMEILAHKAADAEGILPIPEDILENRELIFDIPLEARSGSGTTAEQASHQLAEEGETPGTKATAGDLLGQGTLLRDQETQLTNTTQGTADQDWKINPGGANENEAGGSTGGAGGTGTSIQISFPSI